MVMVREPSLVSATFLVICGSPRNGALLGRSRTSAAAPQISMGRSAELRSVLPSGNPNAEPQYGNVFSVSLCLI